MGASLGGNRLDTHERLRLLVAAALTATLMLALEPSPTAGGSSTTCRVRNSDSGQVYRRLQAAVDEANRGERLNVRGTCVGHTVLDKPVVIRGVTTERLGRPKLTGARKFRVLTVKRRAEVRISDMRILRSRGGVLNHGTLVLVDVRLQGNRAPFAGGVRNDGTLRLEGSSSISRNVLSGLGAGGGVLNEGTLVMNDESVISSNRGNGAGVSNRGSLTMNDRSSIHGNAARSGYAYGSGGGVNNAGTLTMNDASSIHGNRAHVGGGVSNSGSLVMNGTSSIYANVARDYYGYGSGGGVYNEGTITLNGTSSIHDNVAGVEGGGVCNSPAGSLEGVVCPPEESPNVYANSPDDCLLSG